MGMAKGFMGGEGRLTSSTGTEWGIETRCIASHGISTWLSLARSLQPGLRVEFALLWSELGYMDLPSSSSSSSLWLLWFSAHAQPTANSILHGFSIYWTFDMLLWQSDNLLLLLMHTCPPSPQRPKLNVHREKRHNQNVINKL